MIGRDKFFNITAEPQNVIFILVNLILTSICPTPFIVKFHVVLFANNTDD